MRGMLTPVLAVAGAAMVASFLPGFSGALLTRLGVAFDISRFLRSSAVRTSGELVNGY